MAAWSTHRLQVTVPAVTGAATWALRSAATPPIGNWVMIEGGILSSPDVDGVHGLNGAPSRQWLVVCLDKIRAAPRMPAQPKNQFRSARGSDTRIRERVNE